MRGSERSPTAEHMPAICFEHARVGEKAALDTVSQPSGGEKCSGELRERTTADWNIPARQR